MVSMCVKDNPPAACMRWQEPGPETWERKKGSLLVPSCHLCEEKRGWGSSHAGAGQGPGQALQLSHHAWAGNPPPCPWGCQALSNAPLPSEVLQRHGLLQRILEELKAHVLSSKPGLVPSAELACGLLCPRGGSTLPAAAPAQIPTARWAAAAKTPSSPPLGSIRRCLSPRQCAVIS